MHTKKELTILTYETVNNTILMCPHFPLGREGEATANRAITAKVRQVAYSTLSQTKHPLAMVGPHGKSIDTLLVIPAPWSCAENVIDTLWGGLEDVFRGRSVKLRDAEFNAYWQLIPKQCSKLVG